MEACNKNNDCFSIFTSSFNNVEIADDHTRAILIIPLMHVGANKKYLFWTAKMLKKIAPMFRSVPYRYDLEGSEGSSHTINKLSSPHFDVGWSYSSEEGAWYDPKTKSLWTKGEVTHPDVIAKLSRVTSDGKREVNFASMGVIVEKAVCSICGADMEGNVCTNDHTRGQKYAEGICYKIPTEVSKALHIALTNDPADGEAKIENVLFQELGDGMEDNKFKKDGSGPNGQGFGPGKGKADGSGLDKTDDSNVTPAENKEQAGAQATKPQLQNQIPGGLAPSSPQTAQSGEAPSAETILRDLAERIKTIESKVNMQSVDGSNTGQPAEESPELVNTAPQDQFTQDNMGTTSQFATEENKMDVKDAQSTNDKSEVNPEPETQDIAVDSMSQIMEMLQQILTRMGGAETQDMGKEALSASKGQAKKAQDNIATEHLGEGAVGDVKDAGNSKNQSEMMKPGAVATADNSNVENTELADLQKEVKALRGKLELQDNNIPEFGGNNAQGALDVADMGAAGRADKFGDYGKWDACMNGAASAQKFMR